MLATVTRPVAFLAVVTLFWWSFPLSSFTFFVKWLKLSGPRDDMFQWSKFMVACMGSTLHLAGKQRVHHESSRPVMYLANHRSWGDFFLDVYILGGRAMIMARMAVLFAFPVFMSPCVVLKGVLLFKRNITHDKEKFNEWLDKELSISTLNSMLIYPEGHRNIKPDPLPLKRGMLHYAHSRQMVVQVVTTFGKEDVLCEKNMGVGFRKELVTGFSAPIDSAKFKDRQAFIEAVSTEFVSEWARVKAEVPNATELPAYDPQEDVQSCDYPSDMRLKMVALLIASGLAMWMTVLMTVWVCGCFAASVLSAVVAGSVAHQVVTGPLKIREKKEQ